MFCVFYLLKRKRNKALGLKVYTYMNFYLVYAQRKRKKVIQNSHLFILEKGQIYDSQPCMYFLYVFLLFQVLPCLHTFCLGCLGTYLPPESLTITCPLCGQQSILPQKGVSNFFFVIYSKSLYSTEKYFKVALSKY